MIIQITGYIPWQDRKFSRFEYPNIIIEWTWEPPMSGIAGGARLVDISLIAFIIAIAVNIGALFLKEKDNKIPQTPSPLPS
jgi:hypothetical protein